MVELSSLDVTHLVRELSDHEDAFVDRVYQTGPRDLLWRLRHPAKGRRNLLFRLGEWIATAPEAPETPGEPNAFTMGLRKQIAGARIRRIRQHEFDRVAVLSLEKSGEPLEAIVELFGKGNLVLVGPEGTIRLAFRSETYAHRTVKRGEPFRFPPARPEPGRLSGTELVRRAQASQRDLVRFLAVDMGLGGDLAEAAIAEAGLDKTQRALDVPAPALERLLGSLREILRRPSEPAVLTLNGKVHLRSAPLPQWRPAEVEAAYGSLSETILEMARREEAAAPEAKDEEAERLRRQREHQTAGLRALEEEAAALEAAARAAFERYGEFSALLGRIAEAVERHGWDGFQKEAAKKGSWTEIKSVEGGSRRVHVEWAGTTIPVEPSVGLETNVSRLYDAAKAIGDKMAGAREAIERTEEELARRGRRARPVEEAAAAPARKAHWFQSYRWFYTSGGFLVVAGRDAAGNDKLVRKHLKHGDLYVHADVQGAPSCLIKTEGRRPAEADLEEACRFAATYSKAFNRFAAADAFWVTAEQVSKTPQSGEFVPRGAFVVRGERNYRKALPLEAGVGTVRLAPDGSPSPPEAATGRPVPMGGPWVAVAARCPDALRVVRGETKRAQVLRQVSQKLGAAVEDVDAALPAGNLSVEARGT